jgi:hypothetical protein
MHPSEDIRRYRGDWLIEALTSMRRDLDPWTHIPLKPYWMQTNYAGRFHQPTGQWWPDAGDKADTGTPKYKPVRLPGEDAINYPGELWYLTPSWKRDMETLLQLEGVYDELQAYERNIDKIPAQIAYYNPKRAKVVWGPHSIGLRHCVLIVSDATPYEPIKQTAMHACS